MSEQDRPPGGDATSEADRTLLGVAPPKLESATPSPTRSPVFVRSGTSVADVEPPPVPRMALPSRPPRAADGASAATPGLASKASIGQSLQAMLARGLSVARAQPALWMVLAPVLAAAVLIGLLATLSGPKAKRVAEQAPASNLPSREQVEQAAAPPSAQPPSAALSELEARPPESLSSSELLLLAEGRTQRRRDAARALRLKLEHNPLLADDKAVQVELLQLTDDAETARDAVAAMALLQAPIGADLLYEVWTGTSSRTDVTELARALVYSKDVRPKASPALAVALELRQADSCEEYRALLPRALKDADRRALHLLTKLTSRRGCGPKKNADCYACLRQPSDELAATINAAKSRRAPSYRAP